MIYGPIPSAITETFPNAPPENKSIKPIKLFPAAICEKISLSIPNNGTCAKNLNTAIAIRVNIAFSFNPDAFTIPTMSGVGCA